MSGILSAQQIDWIPLSVGPVRPTQGETHAVLRVCGGSRSFNAVHPMRSPGHWMRMRTIPNQSSAARVPLESVPGPDRAARGPGR